MFLHAFTYHFKTLLHSKETLFWSLLFPLVLGTLFFVAFGNLYETDELFTAIPIAVVETQEDEAFTALLDTLGTGEDALLDITYCAEADALSLLEKNKIEGIVYVDSTLHLTVSETGISESILQTILNEYRTKQAMLMDIAMTHPENLPAAVTALSAEVACLTAGQLTDGNLDVYIQYFYNLIAMAALFAALGGMQIALNNQANLSAIAARKSISPIHKTTVIFAEIVSTLLIQFACVAVSLVYLIFILGLDFGPHLFLVFLTALIGTLAAIALGLLIGSIGKMSENTKVGILIAAMMICCFLSGLMIGNMRLIVDHACPFINKINPAALIADAFYSLNLFSDYARYIRNIVTLLIISVVCAGGGIALTRRQKYANL